MPLDWRTEAWDMRGRAHHHTCARSDFAVHIHVHTCGKHLLYSTIDTPHPLQYSRMVVYQRRQIFNPFYLAGLLLLVKLPPLAGNNFLPALFPAPIPNPLPLSPFSLPHHQQLAAAPPRGLRGTVIHSSLTLWVVPDRPLTPHNPQSIW